MTDYATRQLPESARRLEPTLEDLAALKGKRPDKYPEWEMRKEPMGNPHLLEREYAAMSRRSDMFLDNTTPPEYKRPGWSPALPPLRPRPKLKLITRKE